MDVYDLDERLNLVIYSQVLIIMVAAVIVISMQGRITWLEYVQTCTSNGGVYHSFIDSNPTCEKPNGDIYKDVSGQWELVGDNTVILK